MTAHERKLVKYLDGCLRDFESDVGAFTEDSAWGGTVIDIGRAKLPLPYMVFLCFVLLKRYKWWGRDEKLAWTIPVKYKSYPFMFSHRKFGLEVLRRSDVPPPEGLVEEMLTKLNKAFKIVDGIMQPFAARQLKLRNVTVANSYHKLDMMYRFFRKKANASFARPPKPLVLSGLTGSEKGKRRHLDIVKGEREGFYYTTAMLDAYFSRMEHVLVLLLPFTAFDLSQIDLASFIMSGWNEKFKCVFRLESDRRARLLYEQLDSAKEKYRNPMTHGTFEKDSISLYFHFPNTGAIPVGLSEFKGSIHYSFFPLSQASYDEICALFDQTDDFLKSGSTRHGMKYIEAGLDVAFDDKSISRYRSAMKSEERFKAMTEGDSYADMVNMNMDW
jgi:hypothetical protein